MAATIDADGRPWASPLVGQSGDLFEVQDRTTVRARPRPIAGDPLFDNVRANGSLGVLFFNPAIRRRAKSLGQGVVEADGSITYRMHRMFGLCPKYIFKRTHDVDGGRAFEVSEPTRSSVLTEPDRQQLQNADTIFLASHSKIFGSDRPAHRARRDHQSSVGWRSNRTGFAGHH